MTPEQEDRLYIEQLRWDGNPVCPHCYTNKPYRLQAKKDSKNPVREGVWKCRSCRKQFTVTVGTLFEDSHISLSKWIDLVPLFLKKTIKPSYCSLHSIAKTVGITYSAIQIQFTKFKKIFDGEDKEVGPDEYHTVYLRKKENFIIVLQLCDEVTRYELKIHRKQISMVHKIIRIERKVDNKLLEMELELVINANSVNRK